MHDFYEAQQWVALAYIRPEEAAQTLASALKQNLQAQNQAEVLRVSEKTASGIGQRRCFRKEETCSDSVALEKLAAGKNRSAQDFFEALGPLDQAVSIGGVELPPPSSLLPDPAAPTIVDGRVEESTKSSSRLGPAERNWERLLSAIGDKRKMHTHNRPGRFT